MKNIVWIIGLITTLLFSTLVLAETGKRGSAADVAAGEKLYRQFCQSCHKEGGVGELPIPDLIRAPGFVTAMPLNETSHAWHHSDEQLIGTILNGLPNRPRMLAWKGIITESQAKQLVAYMKTFWSDQILNCQGPKHMSCMH